MLTDFSPGVILLVVVGLALAPFVAVMVTSFTKIVVILSLLRNALGLQQVPPNLVLNGLAIILSVYVMYPVLLDMQSRTSAEMQEMPPSLSSMDRLLRLTEVAKVPLVDFLIAQSKAEERLFFIKGLRQLEKPEQPIVVSERDLVIAVPAFVVNELTEAFQIGFLLFLPFLIIDLVISNLLQALGMSMVAPTTVSLPCKLLLFVFISGWTHLIHGLVLTYLPG